MREIIGPIQFLKTEKAQRRLVEWLKDSRPTRGKSSKWFLKASQKRKALLVKYKKQLKKLERALNALDVRIAIFPIRTRLDILDRELDCRCSKSGMCCSYCPPDGDCERCDTIDGVNMEAVNCYASTCDGCAELTMHVDMEMDPHTQLGYCPACVKKDADETEDQKTFPKETNKQQTIRKNTQGRKSKD